MAKPFFKTTCLRTRSAKIAPAAVDVAKWQTSSPVKFSPRNTARQILEWVKRHTIASLIIAVLGFLALLGNAADGIEKIISPFRRATADAGEVAKIRKEVEQQRDAIALIARDANNARAEIGQIAALSHAAKSEAADVAATSKAVQELAEQAAQSVENIKTTSDFALVLARAGADDRKAFDELISIRQQPSHQFHAMAEAALLRIAGDFGGRIKFAIDWSKLGVNPNTVDFDELKILFRTRPRFDQPLIVHGIAEMERLSKADRLTFLRDVIQETKSVAVLDAACMAMNNFAKINKNVIAYRDYLDWWVAHIREYTAAADPLAP